MDPIIEEQRQRILAIIEADFGHVLSREPIPPLPTDRQRFEELHVSTHLLDPFADPVAWENDLSRIQERVIAQGWQLSRRFVQATVAHEVRSVPNEHLAPQIRVYGCDIVYHATQRRNVESILRDGLRPSTQATARRPDCAGNIYLCAELGTPDDIAASDRRQTAYDWCGQLARHEDEDPGDWCVLRVRLSLLPGVQPFRDIWSCTGIIVAGTSIPSELIERV